VRDVICFGRIDRSGEGGSEAESFCSEEASSTGRERITNLDFLEVRVKMSEKKRELKGKQKQTESRGGLEPR